VNNNAELMFTECIRIADSLLVIVEDNKIAICYVDDVSAGGGSSQSGGGVRKVRSIY